MTEDESKKLANLRNKFGAIYTHFQLLEEMEILEKKDPIAHEALKERLAEIFAKNEKVARESMKEVKIILDSFG